MPIKKIMKKIPVKKRISQQSGSSLLEVLISLFVLGVGLLGIMATQVTSLRSNQGAFFVTEAQLLASDMANRIMAYDDIDITSDDDDYNNINTKVATSDPGCVTTGCSTTQQVTYDIFDWGTQLSQRLPSGIGTVNYNSGVYTITVMWDNERTGATGTNCSGDTTVDLACLRLQLMM